MPGLNDVAEIVAGGEVEAMEDPQRFFCARRHAGTVTCLGFLDYRGDGALPYAVPTEVRGLSIRG